MGTAAMAACGLAGHGAIGAEPKKDAFIWAALLHMGYNMWSDVPVPFWGPKANRQTRRTICALTRPSGAR